MIDGQYFSDELEETDINFSFSGSLLLVNVCAEEPAPMIVGGLASQQRERQPCFFTVTVTECPGGIEPQTRWDANSGAAFSPAPSS
ncbi:hypothetical protein CDAR_72681 [Caerostris darwini]|uniref:Uncharacterized protein n=1 Tax=Caerostris darwini TaxID=1538125 RepID=A0AAV4MKQ9_9ARAC|nr:hypothetical protein CDAR_72681 [Caerostris darwini]